MSADRISKGVRRWREAAFATCTAWLVLQNMALLALAAWGDPSDALAAGKAIAHSAVVAGGQLVVLVLSVTLGLALAAWLVHAPAQEALEQSLEVGHDD